MLGVMHTPSYRTYRNIILPLLACQEKNEKNGVIKQDQIKAHHIFLCQNRR